jgi:hypothetical protein
MSAQRAEEICHREQKLGENCNPLHFSIPTVLISISSSGEI